MSTPQFKIGDRVRIIASDEEDELFIDDPTVLVGKSATVLDLDTPFHGVKMDEPFNTEFYGAKPENLELLP